MMGKTNTVYAEASETSELSLKVESILTDTTESIWKIEHVNNMFFVFLDNNRVLYGEDIKSLQYLKKEEEYVNATHVIYTEQTYLFVYDHETEQLEQKIGFEIYKTQDLKQFTIHTITVKEIGKNDRGYIMGIFLSSNKKIVIPFGVGGPSSGYYNYYVYLGVFDSINDIENANAYAKTELYIPLANTSSKYRDVRIFKDRLFFSETDKNANICTFMSLTGEFFSVTLWSVAFIGDIVISNKANSIYYSVNCKDYSLLGAASSSMKIVTVNENNIGIFHNNKFAFAESYKDIIDALESGIDENEIIGDINCSCPVGEYTYLGCSGGMIYKIFVDFSGSDTTPSVSVLKTLSAKQALADSKNYTDKKYAELEARIAALEVSMED